jgi:hypothetical protein
MRTCIIYVYTYISHYYYKDGEETLAALLGDYGVRSVEPLLFFLCDRRPARAVFG